MDAFMSCFRRLFSFWRKEFLSIIKDKASRMVLVAPIIAQSLLFGYAATFDLAIVPFAVLDQSRGTISKELIARFEGSGIFQRVATLDSVKDIPAIIDGEKALVVLHFGPEFDKVASSNGKVTLQVILDGRNSTTSGTAGRYIATIVNEFNARYFLEEGPPVTVVGRGWYNPNFETRWNIMPGLIAALSMLQTLLLSSLSIAREREYGTFEQMLVTPYRLFELILGKALPPMVIGLVQAGLIFLLTRFWFGIPMAGSLLMLYGGLVVFTLAVVGIGLSISAFSATMQQAMMSTFVCTMPFMLLSGLATPISNMPEALQLLTRLNPLRYGLEMVQRIYLEGAGFAMVAHDILPLVAITAVTLPMAIRSLRSKLV